MIGLSFPNNKIIAQMKIIVNFCGYFEESSGPY